MISPVRASFLLRHNKTALPVGRAALLLFALAHLLIGNAALRGVKKDTRG